jgi:hypothetical protein
MVLDIRQDTAVLVCVYAALYAGLRLRVAVEAALDELDFALDFVELLVCLDIVSFGASGEVGRPCYLLVVDRSGQNEA